MLGKAILLISLVSPAAVARDADCGPNCVVVIGPHRDPAPPAHPGDGNRPGHPSGGNVGPQPSDAQRIESVKANVFAEWKGKPADFRFDGFLWEQKWTIMIKGGFESEIAKAKIEGAVLGVYSQNDTYQEARKRLEINVNVDKPYAFRGIGLPIRATTIMINHKNSGSKQTLFVLPKDTFKLSKLNGSWTSDKDFAIGIKWLISGLTFSEANGSILLGGHWHMQWF